MPGVSGISERIDRIFHEKYKERCERRFENLSFIFGALAKSVKSKDPNLEVYIDYHKLSELIRSYFIDVIRYKEYHFNGKPGVDPFSKEWVDQVHKKNINASKVAALTCKWILGYKPIVVVSKASPGTISPVSNVIANINEHFAFNVALYALGVDIADVPDERIEEIIYNFRFRRFEEGAYFMILTVANLTASVDPNGKT